MFFGLAPILNPINIHYGKNVRSVSGIEFNIKELQLW